MKHNKLISTYKPGAAKYYTMQLAIIIMFIVQWYSITVLNMNITRKVETILK